VEHGPPAEWVNGAIVPCGLANNPSEVLDGFGLHTGDGASLIDLTERLLQLFVPNKC
jgi:hypothetical protein